MNIPYKEYSSWSWNRAQAHTRKHQHSTSQMLERIGVCVCALGVCAAGQSALLAGHCQHTCLSHTAGGHALYGGGRGDI